MNKYERRAAVFLAILSLAVIYYSLTKLPLGSIQEPGPGLFPVLCGGGILILCVLWFITNPRLTQTPALWGKQAWKAPAVATLVTLLYAFGLETLGYCTSTFAFLIIWQVAVVHEAWLKTGIIALVGTVTMYVLFGCLLGVPIPQGLLM